MSSHPARWRNRRDARRRTALCRRPNAPARGRLHLHLLLLLLHGRYRAALWEEAGLAEAHGPLGTCPSVKTHALLVATLMCSAVTVHAAADACAIGRGRPPSDDPDCLLLRALMGAGLVCLGEL